MMNLFRTLILALLLLALFPNGRVSSFQTSETYPIALDWSSDGGYLVAGTVDGRLIILNANTQAVLYEEQLFQGTITAVAWAPHTNRVAVGSADGILSIRDGISGNLLVSTQAYISEIFDVSWSADGNYIASVAPEAIQGGLRIWNSTTLEEVSFVERVQPNVVEWKPTDSIVAIGSSNPRGVHIFDFPMNIGVENYQQLSDYRLTSNASVVALAWNADGTLLAVGDGFNGDVYI